MNFHFYVHSFMYDIPCGMVDGVYTTELDFTSNLHLQTYKVGKC